MRSLLSLAVAALLIPTSTTMANPSPLEPYQWKNRLILYRADEESLDKLATLLNEREAGIQDRDLLFLRLGEPPELPFHQPLTPEEIEILDSWTRSDGDTDEGSPAFFLVGKDGGIKGRQSGELDLDEWFNLIDSMPMRQREMRR